MRGLSEQDILTILEAGLRQHPVERAITALAIADPRLSRGDTLALSVGQRDAQLLAIRECHFGTRFTGYAECPRCRTPLEFAFDADDMRVAPPDRPDDEQTFILQWEDYTIQARLPGCADLLAIAGCRAVPEARALLLERCIARAEYQGTSIAVSALPDDAIAALGEAVLERDPQAEIRIELVCSSCDHRWFALFDILTFLWQEIATRAGHILRDVHLLASRYGWSEPEILALGAARRRLYLEMVSA
jgi:hypothetical protein